MNALPTWAYFPILAGLILGSAFFSASETALMRLGRYRLRHLARHGHRGARIAERLLQRPDRVLGIILLGNNFLNILSSVVTTVLALRLGGDRTVAIATGILTFVMLIIAEIAPKTLAALKPEPIAFGVSYVLIVLLKVLYPIVWVLNLCANGLLFLFGLRLDKVEEIGLTRDELRTLVMESGQHQARRQQMLLGVLELEEATVEDVMVPRSRIEGIDIGQDGESVRRQLVASRHSRLPLYRSRIEDTVGVVHMRDLAVSLANGDFDPAQLEALSREPYFVPEGTTLARQLVNFRQRNKRWALVVDEYGDILGLLTLEDVLQEIAGELNQVRRDEQEVIVREPDGSVLVPGYLGVRRVNKHLGWKLPTDGPRTLNGLVLEQLETMPESGATVDINGHRGEIVETNESGVVLLRFEEPAQHKPTAHEK
ncbi:MAG: HlyC/CorC family transporter [Gammaproteobacteria bacterium]